MASPFPPPPVSTIDWANVGFRVREGECHPSLGSQSVEWWALTGEK